MGDVLRVQVRDGGQELREDIPRVIFLQPLLAHDLVVQLASRHAAIRVKHIYEEGVRAGVGE